MKLIDGQILHRLCQVLYRHAEIVSGAYKLRKIKQGVEGGGWRDYNDEEKLRDSMSVMQRQIHLLQDAIEYLPSKSEED